MKWTKANVEYPVESGWQLARVNGKKIPLMFAPHVISDVGGRTYQRNEVEWFDESDNALPTDEQLKTEAEDFADSKERRGCSYWSGLKKGYIEGRTKSLSIQKEMGLLLMDKDSEIESLKNDVAGLEAEVDGLIDERDMFTVWLASAEIEGNEGWNDAIKEVRRKIINPQTKQ